MLGGLCGVAAAQTADTKVLSNQILPKDTYFYMSVPSVQEMKATFEDSSAGRMWADPALEEFKAELNNALSGEVSDAFSKIHDAIGLTVEEFRGLVDSIKSIEHLGRLKRKLMLSNREADFEVQRDAIVAKLAEKKGGKERDTVNTYAELARRGIGKFAAEHRKFASLALEADGFDYGGPMTVALTHSMNAAGATEAGMRNNVIPGARMLSVVTMKFTADVTEPMPSMISPIAQKSGP